jgi:hypothetical protein
MMSLLLEAAGVPPIAAHALGVGAGGRARDQRRPQTVDRMAQAKALTGSPN